MSFKKNINYPSIFLGSIWPVVCKKSASFSDGFHQHVRILISTPFHSFFFFYKKSLKFLLNIVNEWKVYICNDLKNGYY